MKLTHILGYQLDMTRHAAMRSIHRFLADSSLRPADTTALLLVREQPGCDQTMLGRALAGNRSVGMKVASRLEAKGLLTRGEGRDRRSKGLHITPDGERALAEMLGRHARAEAVLASRLDAGEREQLLRLLAKVRQAVREEEVDLADTPSPSSERRVAAPPQAPAP